MLYRLTVVLQKWSVVQPVWCCMNDLALFKLGVVLKELTDTDLYLSLFFRLSCPIYFAVRIARRCLQRRKPSCVMFETKSGGKMTCLSVKTIFATSPTSTEPVTLSPATTAESCGRRNGCCNDTKYVLRGQDLKHLPEWGISASLQTLSTAARRWNNGGH